MILMTRCPICRREIDQNSAMIRRKADQWYHIRCLQTMAPERRAALEATSRAAIHRHRASVQFCPLLAAMEPRDPSLYYCVASRPHIVDGIITHFRGRA